MASTKLRVCFGLVLIAPILVLSATKLRAQTPDAKTKPTGSISGRVTIGEKPAPGILIAVGGLNSSMPTAQTTSDADGNYRIGGLAAGQINVTPVAPVYVVPVSPMFGQGRVVNLAANEAVEGIDFKLTRGGVITGRITDADGRPVVEQRVSLISVDENGAIARGPTYRSSNFMMNQTDDRGVYRIYGLPAGHYKVSVGEDAGRSSGLRVSGYYQRVYYPDASEINKAGIVDVNEGGEAKNIDLKLGRLSSTYSVSGRIIDADTGQPLPGVYFSFGAVQQNQNQSYVSGTSGPANPTNSQGEFRMEGLSPGRYVLVVNSQGVNPNLASRPAAKVYSEPFPFEIFDGDVSNLEIKANQGLTLSGIVVPDGITDKIVLARISKLMVVANVNPGPNELRVFLGGSVAKLNPDGSFLIEGLRPGKVTLNVGAGGPESFGFTTSRIEYNGVAPSHELDLPPGQDISGVKIFVAYGTGVVRGQLKIEGGTLPADAAIFISVNRQGEPSRFNGQVDSRGRFLIRGISPGTYDVVLQIISFGVQQLPRGFQRQQRQTVTVADGSDTEVFFTLDLSRKDVP